MRLGIDFGTCFSNAALMMGEEMQTVRNPIQHGYSFPSSVYVTEGGELLIGSVAENARLQDLQRYKREFKRELGQTIPYQLAEHRFKPEDLVSAVLREIKREAEKMVEGYGHRSVTSVLITVPATYQPHKRGLMEQAARAAGFGTVTLLEEPVAAAIYYLWQRRNRAVKNGEIILVYDLGGGTFDTALIQKNGRGYDFLAPPLGLEQCGGVDFDRQIYADLATHCSEQLASLLAAQRRDINALRARSNVQDSCRDLKHQLSQARSAEISIPISLLATERYELTQDKFNRLIQPFLDETIQLCQQLVENAGIKPEQVDAILLVGGSCRIPYVRKLLEQKLERPVFQVDDPDLAVCRGAAIYGFELDQKQANPIVSVAGGWGKYDTINEAIQRAQPGDRIKVEPGIYRESLVIDKPVEIVGDGSTDEIIIESTNAPCLVMQTSHTLVRGLSLRCRTEQPDSSHCTVDIPQGKLVLEECDITSDSLTCIAIHGSEAKPVIRNCKIHDARGNGVAVYDNGQGELEKCDIFGNAQAGIKITQGGNPLIRNCQIHDGQDAGVYVCENGQGMIDSCDIFSNTLAGVAIQTGGNPTIRQCKIHDGQHVGIYVDENGQGMIDSCEIFGNASSGVAIQTGGTPTIRQCKIHDGKADGVLFLNDGQGVIQDCEIFGNTHPGVAIKTGGNPTIQHCKIYNGQDAGVYVCENGQGMIDSCDIFSNTLAGVAIQTGGNPIIRQCKIHDGQDVGIYVDENGQGAIEDCDIFSNALAGVAIQTGGHPTIRQCQIRDGKANGVLVLENGQGAIEDCDIFSNALAGVAIQTGGHPTIRQCKIHDGKQGGVYVYENGQGTVQECDIFGNALAGVEIRGNSKPVIQRCQIYDGKQGAILVHQNGQGTVQECDIFGNALAGVAIQTGGHPTIRQCQIRDGKEGGVYVYENGQGTVQECDIFGNAKAGVEIRDGGDPLISRCKINRNGYVAVTVHQKGAGTVEGCDLSDNTGGVWALEAGSLLLRRHNTPLTWEYLHTCYGHSNWVKAVAISRPPSVPPKVGGDEGGRQVLASGSYDNSIKLWNFNTGQEIRPLTGHSASVRALAISPDGRMLVSAGHDCTIKLWDLKTGQELGTLTGHSRWVRSLAISPDGQILVSGSDDYTIKLWALKSGQEIRTLTGHLQNVCGVAISPDGQMLASASDDNTIKLWNLSTYAEIHTLRGHLNDVHSVAFTPDANFLVSGSKDKQVKLWNLHTKKVVYTQSAHEGWINGVEAVAVHPDGQLFASCGANDTIKIWHLQSGKLLQTLTGHSGYVNSVAFSPDGQFLVSGSDDNTIKIWAVEGSDWYDTLRRLLRNKRWDEADQESIRLVRQMSGHQCIDNEQKAQAIPADLLRIMNRLWLNAGGGALKDRNWVRRTAGNVTTFKAFYSFTTWLGKRLNEVDR